MSCPQSGDPNDALQSDVGQEVSDTAQEYLAVEDIENAIALDGSACCRCHHYFLNTIGMMFYFPQGLIKFP